MNMCVYYIFLAIGTNVNFVITRSENGRINVEVKSDGQPISAAKVIATSINGYIDTSSSGIATFTDVAFGTYTLTVKKSGYKDSINPIGSYPRKPPHFYR